MTRDLASYVGQRIHITSGTFIPQRAPGARRIALCAGDEILMDAEFVLATLAPDRTSWLDKPSSVWAWGPAPDDLKSDARTASVRILQRAINAGLRGQEEWHQGYEALGVVMGEADQ